MLNIAQISCSSFDLSVNTGIATNVQVKVLQDDKTLLLKDTVIVPASGVYNLTLTDGVYTLTDTDTGTNFKIIVYCGFESCLLSKIKKLICKDADCGCGCEDKSEGINEKYNFNAIALLYFTFLSLLNSTYVVGWQFSTLSTTDLDDLYVISQIIKQGNNYCNCNCND
jgi:hypothetical protein